MIDRTSRWPEVVPLANISAETCADAFVSGWVSHHGVPHTVTTDRGTQFVSSTWQCLACKPGFRHITTTSFHPQANGMVERLHRQIKYSLRARQCGTAWLDHLLWTLLGLRVTPKDNSGVSSADVVFGVEFHIRQCKNWFARSAGFCHDSASNAPTVAIRAMVGATVGISRPSQRDMPID
jgi:transposase InsO family protein